ncbi:TonB-dependent receptor [Compostibacter hankyongensis]|uniref:TonB-dependent receptor n=1 Tax=Compostibacter hankyongensis TaxID=1007089 RepID=A0ABP8FEK9_9BACT
MDGSASGAITDVQGGYVISGISAGSHTVTVKYIGYATKSISDVMVKDGAVTTLDVVMDEPSSESLKEVVITSSYRQESVTSLLVNQKNSMSVSSGISADQISRSPDKNIGQVLKRVSGASIQDNKFVVVRGLNDRYNNATLNNVLLPSSEPDRKAFSFDIIPSGLIDNVVINKTALPDKPGDFAGGLIQIHTKDFPEQQFFSFTLGTSYNTISTFKDVLSGKRTARNFVGFDDGSHRLPDGVPADQKAFNGLSGAAQDRMNRSFENTWQINPRKGLPAGNFQFTMGKTFYGKTNSNRKLGFILSVTDNYSETNQLAERSDYNIDTKSFNYHLLDTTGTFQSSFGALANIAYSNGRSTISFKNLYNRVYNDQTIIRHRATDPQPPFHYVTYANFHNLTERSLYSGTLEGLHAVGGNDIRINWSLNYSGLERLEPDSRIVNYTNDHAIVDQPVNGGSSRSFSNVNDNIYNGQVAVSFPFKIDALSQELKIGGLTQYRDRKANYRPLSYHRSSSFPFDQLTLPPYLLFAPENLGSEGLYLRDDSSPENKYEANSFLKSGFAMLQNELGKKLKLIWGFRFESYHQELAPVSEKTGIRTTDTTYNSLLPSVNLIYALNKKTNLRASYSNTVARPELREIASYSFYDFLNSASVFGNPRLRQTRITNIDLRYEWYPRAGETVNAALFYKKFKDPISESWASQDNNDRTYINLNDAVSYGAEVELRKDLAFVLGDWGKNSFLSLNGSYIYSRIKNPNSSNQRNVNGDTRPLPGQSPYLVNIGLQIGDPGNTFSATILYNRTGERINTVGDDSSNKLDIFEAPRNQLDVQLRKKVFHQNGEVKLGFSNLLNANYLLYQNKNDKKSYQRGDYTYYKYRLGTDISLSLNYTIK